MMILAEQTEGWVIPASLVLASLFTIVIGLVGWSLRKLSILSENHAALDAKTVAEAKAGSENFGRMQRWLETMEKRMEDRLAKLDEKLERLVKEGCGRFRDCDKQGARR